MADHPLCGVSHEEKGGRLCTELGTIDDWQRGRKVCAAGRPRFQGVTLAGEDG